MDWASGLLLTVLSLGSSPAYYCLWLVELAESAQVQQVFAHLGSGHAAPVTASSTLSQRKSRVFLRNATFITNFLSSQDFALLKCKELSMPALVCRAARWAAPFPHSKKVPAGFLWAFSPLACLCVLLVLLNHWISKQNIQHSKWAKLALNNIFLWLYRSLFAGMMIFDPESECIYGTSFKTHSLCRILGGLIEPHRPEDNWLNFNLSPAVSSVLSQLTFTYLAQ